MSRLMINLAFWISLLLTGVCSAQSPPQEYGFLNIANMVPKHPACDIQIDDKELMPGGLKAINATGWFIVPQGTYRMTLKIEGFESAKGNITVSPQDSTLCVIFLQQIGNATDREGKPIPPKVRIKRFVTPKTSKGRTLQIVSLCPLEESFQIGGKAFQMKLFDQTEISPWSGAPWTVVYNKKTIGQCNGAEEKGHYTLLLGSNHKKTLAALMVRTDQQELPPWMKEKNP